ncbi:MAG TPA: four helix bundle protein [Burkholderiales bacterium]|nr:four helix bundle protein [Burkholderiales bacterium]
MSSFEDLEVWKRSVKLSADLYKGLQNLRDYGFKDQLTRAGLSIASNIAEGMERDSQGERARYLTISRSSCGEVRTQVYVGIDVGYIDEQCGKRWIRESREISAMLVGLSRSITG